MSNVSETIKVNTKQFADAIKSIEKSAASSKEDVVLSGIYVSVAGESMTLRAKGHSIESECKIQAKGSECDFLVPSNLLSMHINTAVSLGDENLSLILSESDLKLKSKNVPGAKIPMLDKTKYPEKSNDDDWIISFQLPEDVFAEICKNIGRPARKSRSEKPFTKVVHFDFNMQDAENGSAILTAVAIDGIVQVLGNYKVILEDFNKEAYHDYLKENGHETSANFCVNLDANLLFQSSYGAFKDSESVMLMMNGTQVSVGLSNGTEHVIQQSMVDFINYRAVQANIQPGFLQIRVKTEEFIRRAKAVTQISETVVFQFSEKNEEVFKITAYNDSLSSGTEILVPCAAKWIPLEDVPETGDPIADERLAATYEIMKTNKEKVMDKSILKLGLSQYALEFLEDYRNYPYLMFAIGHNQAPLSMVPLVNDGVTPAALGLLLTPVIVKK